MNILRKAVKAFSLDLLYYEIFKYLPMSLFVVNLVASSNLEKHYAKSVLKILTKSFKNACESVYFVSQWLLLLLLKYYISKKEIVL